MFSNESIEAVKKSRTGVGKEADPSESMIVGGGWKWIQ